LPVFISKAHEKVDIDDKEKALDRVLLVSDIHICLFEHVKSLKHTVQLVFWSSLRSLVTIRRNPKDNLVRFFFKQKHRKPVYELALAFTGSANLVADLLKTMQFLGIQYKVNRQGGSQKSGTLPQVDIENVEKSLKVLEIKVEHNPDTESVEQIMDLYQKAIEYYSATNNEKYEIYLEKMHKILKCPLMSKFLGEETKERLSPVKQQKDKFVHNINGFNVNSQQGSLFVIEKNTKYEENKEGVTASKSKLSCENEEYEKKEMGNKIGIIIEGNNDFKFNSEAEDEDDEEDDS